MAITTPEQDAIFSQVQGAKYFSKIDLKNAFLQIPLTAEASSLTVINTPFGLYQYNFLPFGLSCSPSIFQQTIDQVIKSIPNTVAYQDDILIYTNDLQQHNEVLTKLLSILQRTNIRINAQKSSFFKTSIPYFGFCLSGAGIFPDSIKVQPLAKAPAPTTTDSL